MHSNIDKMTEMIDLNVTAVVRLTYALVPSFSGATAEDHQHFFDRGYRTRNAERPYTEPPRHSVLAFSLSLHKELAANHIRIQAVLPGATATEFWGIAGTPVEHLPSQIVMTADDLVDAAIAGLDKGERSRILHYRYCDWDALGAFAIHDTKLSLTSPAARYGISSRRTTHINQWCSRSRWRQTLMHD